METSIRIGEGDWTEDFNHENGQYLCLCFKCGKNFIGHKRRVECKECATKLPNSLIRGN
jgi:hypothetical protein